jgi:hypothetical protein
LRFVRGGLSMARCVGVLVRLSAWARLG